MIYTYVLDSEGNLETTILLNMPAVTLKISVNVAS